MLRLFVSALVAGAVVLAPVATPVRSRSSPVAVAGARVVAVNPDSGSISVIDATKREKTAEIVVCPAPQTVAISDSRKAFVACASGVLKEVDLEAMRVTRSVIAGNEPFGVAVASGRVYVTLFADARLAVLDEASLVLIASIPMEEFPRGITIEGDRIYVTHFRSGRLSVIDRASLSVMNVISTGADSNVSQSVAVSGNRAWLPQTRSNATNPALLFDSTAFPIVSAIDLDAGANLPKDRIAIDIADRPSSLPIDIALTASGKALVVNAGSDDVSVIDLSQRRAAAHLAMGSNPRGIALSPDESVAYVNNTLSGSVTVIDVGANSVAATIPVTTIPLEPSILNGKILFNTSNRDALARDRWIACATCHFDGGTDGRTWFFRDGPRNTPPLFGTIETMPMHWSGDLDELQDVESTVRTIQAGTGLATGASHCEPACDTAPPNAGRSQDLDDLAAFMRTLRPPPRAISMNDAALRGRALFFDPRTGCASCHPPPFFTDRKKHGVGTGTSALERKGTSFDTPSLRGIAFTAPYMHDGSQATLLDVVRAATGPHGLTTMLTESEKSDLAEFLRTLSFGSGAVRRQ